MRHLLLLLLPTVTLANIKIDLQGTIHSGKVSSAANYKGFDEHVMTEKDKVLFGIQKEGLKLDIGKINGKKPDDVFTNSATPFGDLYKRYGWKQVNMKIQPNLHNIFINYKYDTVKLSKTKYENSNSRPKNTLINENGYLTNNVYNYWTGAANITAGDLTITFNFDIEDKKAYFNKIFTLGVNQKYMQKVYYETNTTIFLEPGQKVTAELEALRQTVKIEIPYDVSLSGDAIAKYNQMYKDKFFFKFDINDILKANNITTIGSLHQTLIYEFLSDAKVHIRDSADIILKSISAGRKTNTKGLKKAVLNTEDHDKVKGVPMTRKDTPFDIPNDLVVEIIDDENDGEESEENVKEKPENPAIE